jgi:SAM-dependent methyltransferase
LKNQILKYFEDKASCYQELSGQGLWGWQRTREREAVFDLLGSLEGRELLDLGCGSGYYARYALSRNARHVVGVDISPSMIAALPKKQVTGHVDQAETITFPQYFSRILSAGLLEFVAEPQVLLKNARKQVSSDGTLVILLPEANFFGRIYRQFHRLHGFEIKLFSMDSIIMLAETAGWTYSCSRVIFPFSLVCKFTASL